MLRVEIAPAPAPEIPQPRVITIGEIASGDAKPSVTNDRLRWHVSIKCREEKGGINWGTGRGLLLQGFGGSVHEGIADAVLRMRQELALYTRQLAEVERELGSQGMSDERLAQLKGEL